MFSDSIGTFCRLGCMPLLFEVLAVLIICAGKEGLSAELRTTEFAPGARQKNRNRLPE